MDELDYIYKKNSNHRYYKSTCGTCGIDRGYKRKHLTKTTCASCASKKRQTNPMLGRSHSNREKFRKHNYLHYDYNDVSVRFSKAGNKCVRYRKHCPCCATDMGYHRNIDGDRVCRGCQADKVRMYTPEQKRIKSSMKASISARLRSRNSSKNYTSTFLMLSYTLEELLERLESKFTEGMAWDNYGMWEIDHITPDSWFSYESYNDEGFMESWSLGNLQPLWKSENASKGNRYKG